MPLGRAAALQAELETDRGNIALSAGRQGNAALQLSAHHRVMNPLEVTAQPGAALKVHARLLVDPPQADAEWQNVTVSHPATWPRQLRLPPWGPSVPHSLEAALSPAVSLTLTVRSGCGDQTLNLAALRLQTLRAASRCGDQTVTLPAGTLGTVSLQNERGDIRLKVPPAARVQQLDLSTESGDIQAELPQQVQARLSTGSGHLRVLLAAQAAGTLNIHAGQDAAVTLRLPPRTALRLHSSDQAALEDFLAQLPSRTREGLQPPEGAPALEVNLNMADLAGLNIEAPAEATP